MALLVGGDAIYEGLVHWGNSPSATRTLANSNLNGDFASGAL
jgi:hypothetical protein